ncbi:16S rRNA (guanine527-N7)-methyltransferase [Sphingomonas insulae]|nr:16S rRNA (guanine(527)-N(7))-methyltransferase RsmG [Sphingomonas insulae]NIJ30119.1 16S rRNA (guanine527-N7)-methyltransferase [Sphingomonas insulae]
MTEAEARDIIVARFGEAKARQIDNFVDLVREENSAQNLIAPSTIETIWTRHVLDSAQLMFHVEHFGKSWLDIGTGGGFPGIIVAILLDGATTMVEPRRRRAEFLQRSVDQLGIEQAVVLATKVEAVSDTFDIISARAVASVEKLLQAAGRCATPETRWVLPRGRLEAEQLVSLRRDESRLFHVKHSTTDPESSILIVEPNKGTAR